MKNEQREPRCFDGATLSGARIARISTVPFFVVAQLKYQLEMLGKCGAKVTVITSAAPELALLEKLDGITCVPVDIPRSISPWRDLQALVALVIFFNRERIQIAHSTTPKAGLLTALAALVAGVPVRLHTFTGQPWVTMRGIKRWLAKASEKLIGKLNTRCYTDSESQRQFLISQGIVDASKVFVIGAGSLAGVDEHRFDCGRFSQEQKEAIRESLGISKETLVLLFMGRITVDKGVRELIEAYKKVKVAVNDVHLVFVGRFDNESGVEGLISPSDIEHLRDVHLVDYTENPETYLAIADILCLPSYREGFGTVVIEAAAMGVPTIGTNIYGLTDAVVHGETGLLITPRNVEELVSALTTLLTDKPLRIRMGDEAKRRALVLFSASKVNGQVVDEYRALLRGR